MKFRSAIGFLGALLFLPVCSGAVPAKAYGTLGTDVLEALKADGLVGATWMTVRPDGAIEVGSAGLKNARTKEPLQPGDRVHIGSVTKTLLATGVLQLVSTGKLQLQTPVAQLLPWLSFQNPWAASDPVRVRHLLDHTSGIEDARLWQIFSAKADPDTPLSHSFERRPSLLRVRTRPGSQLSYSNTGYVIAALVIEAISGERYESYLDRQLLGPLGMNDSSFQFVSQSGDGADPRLAMGHFEDGVTAAAAPIFARPAVQFTTTAHDMGLFARFLMGDGQAGGQRLVDEPLMRRLAVAERTDAAKRGLTAGYALGLGRRDRHGVIGLCHSGNTVGYRARLCVFPDQQKAFFISFNADSETADYERFNKILIDHLGIAKTAVTPVIGVPADIVDWDGFFALRPGRFDTFAYLDTVFGFAVVRWKDSALSFSPLQGATRTLHPVGNALYRSDEQATASHVLFKGEDGTPLISDGFRTYGKTSGLSLGLLWASLAAGLVGMVWILLSAAVRLTKRRSFILRHPNSAPFLAILCLLVPAPFFWAQSYLQMGDLTTASALLALVTGILPLAMIYGLGRGLRRGLSGWRDAGDTAAAVAVLQWCLVLFAWDLLPIRLWV